MQSKFNSTTTSTPGPTSTSTTTNNCINKVDTKQHQPQVWSKYLRWFRLKRYLPQSKSPRIPDNTCITLLYHRDIDEGVSVMETDQLGCWIIIILIIYICWFIIINFLMHIMHIWPFLGIFIIFERAKYSQVGCHWKDVQNTFWQSRSDSRWFFLIKKDWEKKTLMALDPPPGPPIMANAIKNVHFFREVLPYWISLRWLMQKGTVFRGFKEHLITFKPTYKYLKTSYT